MRGLKPRAPAPGEGGGLSYERAGDARQKFSIKPIKETDLHKDQAFLIPKRHHFKTWTNKKYGISSRKNRGIRKMCRN